MPFKDREKRKEASRESMQKSRQIDSPEAITNRPEAISELGEQGNLANKPLLPVKTDKPTPQADSPPILKYERYSTPYQVDKRTRILLDQFGWCLWKCTKLNDEIICIIRDDSVRGYPEKYPVFTDQELRQLNQNETPLETWLLIIEAKKHAGKVLIEA